MNESTKKLFKAAADIIVKNCGDRKIFFLGSGDDFQNYLRDEYKIEISGYATDMAPKAVNGKMMLDDMINKTNEYYIVVPMIRSSPTLRKRFKQLGYQLNKDYLFVHRSNTVIMPFSPDYRDSYGNFVHAGGCRVVIGKEVQNSYVYVGDNFKSDGDCLIRVFGQGNARVVIGNNCKSNGEVKFFVYTGAELTIGDDMKVSKNATISVMDNNRVHIGKECMISYEVKLFSGDGHAIFDTETRIPAEKICFALNQRLPKDIVCLSSREVNPDFHPRHADCTKTYEYSIYNAVHPDPIKRRYSYFVYVPLDIDAMRKAAEYLVGEHDFASFCSAHAQVKTTVRTVYSLDIICDAEYEDAEPVQNAEAAKRTYQAQDIKIRISGNGFLYNMVRIIVGTLVKVGYHFYPPEYVKTILDACDRTKAGPKAPAEGLKLIDIKYDPKDYEPKSRL